MEGNLGIHGLIGEWTANSLLLLRKLQMSEHFKIFFDELRAIPAKDGTTRNKRRRTRFLGDRHAIEVLMNVIHTIQNEIIEICHQSIDTELANLLKRCSSREIKRLHLKNGKMSSIPSSLIYSFPSSYFYERLIDTESRTSQNCISIEEEFNYLPEIIRYMQNKLDVTQLDGNTFDELCKELIAAKLPFTSSIFSKLYTNFNVLGVGWKNRYMLINNQQYQQLFNVMKLGQLHYDMENERIYMTILINEEPTSCSSPIPSNFTIKSSNMNSYFDDIDLFTDYQASDLFSLEPSMPYEVSCITDLLNDFESFLKDQEHYTRNYFINLDTLDSLFSTLHIDETNSLVHQYMSYYTSSLIFPNSTILEDRRFDDFFAQWIDTKCSWKLIYRASEHNYTAKSFHQYCDDKGPTLVLVKSTNGCIFGGYTTQSWKCSSVEGCI